MTRLGRNAVARTTSYACSPHERSDMREAVSPGYRFAHPGYSIPALARYRFASSAICCASMPISRNCPVGETMWPQK